LEGRCREREEHEDKGYGEDGEGGREDGMGEKIDVRGRRSEMGMAEASELLVLGIQGRA